MPKQMIVDFESQRVEVPDIFEILDENKKMMMLYTILRESGFQHSIEGWEEID